MLINDTEFYRLLESKISNCKIETDSKYEKYTSIIKSTFDKFKEHSSKSTLFNSYTNHSETHSINIIKYMWQLSPKPNDLNEETIFYLIMAAICHDFGLLISNDDKQLIKSNEYIKNQKNYYDWKSTKEFIKYQNPQDSDSNIENKTLQLIARNLHTNREVIMRKINHICPNELSHDVKDNLSLICYAHGVTPEIIEQLLHNSTLFHQGNDLYNKVDFGFVIALLRLGDILDIGVNRNHNVSEEYNNFDNENTKHAIINSLIKNVHIGYDKNDYSVCGSTTEKQTQICPRYPKTITLTYNNDADPGDLLGDCLNYLFDYIGWIEEEITNANKYFLCKCFSSNECDYKYYHATMLFVFPKVKQSDFPKEFEYRLIGMDKKSVVKLITSENLYPNKESFLRELIQNAIDACMFYSCISGNSMYNPEVKIKLEADSLSIEDNGIGMTSNVLINYYLKIGASYYSSNEYIFSKNQFSHAGNFGIGAYSVFLVSNEVIIETRRENETIRVEYGQSKNYVKISKPSDSNFGPYEHGTKIKLRLKDEFKEYFKNINHIKNYISVTFLKNENISLKLFNSDNSETDLGANLKSLDEWCTNKYSINNIKMENLDDYFNGIDCRIAYEKIETINKYFDSKSQAFVDDCGFNVGQEVLVYSYENDRKKHNFIILNNDERQIYGNEKLRVVKDLCIVNNIKFVDLNIPNNSVVNCFKARVISINNGKTIINSSLYGSYSGCSVFPIINIFLHNIHIRNADFNLELLPNINVYSCVLNIKNPIVVPTITRDDISADMLTKIRDALFYAILKKIGLDGSLFMNDVNSNPFIRKR